MTTAPDTEPRSLPSDADEPGDSPSTTAGTGGAGDGVDWLSAHEETVWRRWLAVSSRIPAALSSQLQSDSGLSLQDYDVLVMLNDSESSSCRITELAGVALGTFYVHFTGKKEIFDEVVLDLSRRVRQAMSEASSAAPDRLTAERDGFRAFFADALTKGAGGGQTLLKSQVDVEGIARVGDGAVRHVLDDGAYLLVSVCVATARFAVSVYGVEIRLRERAGKSRGPADGVVIVMEAGLAGRRVLGH